MNNVDAILQDVFLVGYFFCERGNLGPKMWRPNFWNMFVKENWVKNVEACPQDG